MKKLIALTVLVACATAFAADSDPVASRKRRGIGRPNGGFIELANTGKVIQVSNSQALCPVAAVEGTVTMIRHKFGYPVQFSSRELTGAFPTNVALRINVVAKDDAPVLLAAPEEGWAQINVKPLTVDNPDEIKLRKRVIKEMWRGFAYAFGVGMPMDSFSVMKQVDSLAALDECPVEFGPEAQLKIENVAKKRGLYFSRRVSYRVACKEGWAPAPTNDIQKVIWEEYHAKPTEPMRIKFDPKQGK